jgi:hypothetical protein
MRHFYFLLLFSLFISVAAKAQTDSVLAKPDSLKRDSVQRVRDSITITDSVLIKSNSAAITDSMWLQQDSLPPLQPAEALIKTETRSGDPKFFSGKEDFFYYLIFLLLLFGFLKILFAKYFNDLFRVFFRTTLKQKQVREQLLQSPLPSIAMNGFFVLSAGMYINFILQYFELSLTNNFWLQYLYCMGALASVYFVKYIGLKITGWLFNVSNAVDAYTFIVFIINKMLGMFLLPFLVLLAFTGGKIYQIALALSWVGVGLLLAYRIILSYGAARNEIKLNPFHFILYIIAFEIVPLLLIYKLLLMIF